MTAPQPGDRVRVTVVGVVEKRGSLYIAMPENGTAGLWLDRAESVEVLPKPVYVNHDTAEMHNGDVAVSTNARNTYMRVAGEWVASMGAPCNYSDASMRGARLLVRDGKAVPE